ncbi:hypothetical protein [Croceicoccus sp. YJ47]|uniref:hypothetical protein n=1 Tax=Croceicoccus sp. YJ47 TaxID=2798724 RepID=UPI0019221D3C|nr:hypothetical protein [Croceicoccus sp. YJ47]QQN73625.1 hypothetical protein JD971_12580 [Croceicoccus sp. YJ47]
METKNPHASGAGASKVLFETNAKEATATRAKKPVLSAFTDPRHRVVIRDIGGMFQVTVEPEHPAHTPETYATYKQARGYAGGLRMVNRWPLQDETEASL